jgi:type IV secretion system protein VirB2
VYWVASALTGSVATAVATIAVAATGFAFLQGRVEARRAARAVFGCFIIFGAPMISSTLIDAAVGSDLPTPVAAPSQVRASTPPPVSYDPYAGASVPVR